MADGYGYPGSGRSGGSSGGGYGYPGGSSAQGRSPSGGKSRAQRRAEQRQQGPVYPKEQLLRLASRLYRVKDLDRRSEIADELKNKLDGYSPNQIRAIGRKAGLRDSELTGLVLLTDVTTEGDIKRAAAQSTFKSDVATALDYLGRPSQFVVSGLAGGAEKGNYFDPERAWSGFTGNDRTTPTEAAFELGGQSRGEAQDSAEALPGPVRFTGDLVGSVALDPTTYITFGAGPGVRAGVRSAAEEVAARRLGVEVGSEAARQATQDLGQEIGRRGLRALTSTERAELPRSLRRAVRRAPGGMRVAGHAVPGSVQADQLFRSVGRRATQAGLDEVPIARTVSSLEPWVAPRAEARQLSRTGVAPDLHLDIENAEALFKGRTRTGLEVGSQRARRAVEGPAHFRYLHPERLSDEQLARVRNALENPRLVDGLSPRERAAFDAFDEMRRDVDVMRVDESRILRTEDELDAAGIDALPLDRRFPRYLSREAEKLQRRGGLPPVGRADEGGLAAQRLARDVETKYDPTDTITLLNGDPRFELDPATALARDYANATRDAARVEFVDTLRTLTDERGVPMLRVDVSDADRASGAWVEKQLPIRDANGEGLTRTRAVWIRREISEDFDRLAKVVSDDATRSRWAGYLNKFMGLWKAYATSPLPFGFGFMIRNFEGNLVNGFLLGNTNPLWLFKAHRLRNAMLKGIRESGNPLLHLAAKDRALVEDALDTGVLSTGYFTNLEDLGRLPKAPTRARGAWRRAGRAGNKVNPLSQEALWLQGGRAMNEAVEDTSRLGMFLGQRAKGLNAAESSRMVRTYLFDYTDTAPVLRGLRYVSPFATWAYKNTPLQLATLLRTPGKITAQKHAFDALANLAVPHETEDVPQWMTEGGGVTLPFTAGGTALEWVPDLPIASARETVDPALKFLDIVRGKPNAYQEFGRSVSNAEGLGGLAGVLDALHDVGTGRDMFTQRPFYPGERVQTPSYLQPFVAAGVVPDTIPRPLQYLMESALPGASKVRGALPTDPEDKGKQLRRLLSLLTGQTVYPLDDAASRSETYRRLDELDALRRSLEAQGVYVPDARRRRTAGSGSR